MSVYQNPTVCRIYDMNEFNGDDHVAGSWPIATGVGAVTAVAGDPDFGFRVSTGTQGLPLLVQSEGDTFRSLLTLSTHASEVAAYASGNTLYAFAPMPRPSTARTSWSTRSR